MILSCLRSYPKICNRVLFYFGIVAGQGVEIAEEEIFSREPLMVHGSFNVNRLPSARVLETKRHRMKKKSIRPKAQPQGLVVGAVTVPRIADDRVR